MHRKMQEVDKKTKKKIKTYILFSKKNVLFDLVHFVFVYLNAW